MARFLGCGNWLDKQLDQLTAGCLNQASAPSRLVKQFEPGRWARFRQGVKRSLCGLQVKHWGPADLLGELDRLGLMVEYVSVHRAGGGWSVADELERLAEQFLLVLIRTDQLGAIARAADGLELAGLSGALGECGLEEEAAMLAMLPVYTEVWVPGLAVSLGQVGCLLLGGTSHKKFEDCSFGAVFLAAARDVLRVCLEGLTGHLEAAGLSVEGFEAFLDARVQQLEPHHTEAETD